MDVDSLFNKATARAAKETPLSAILTNGAWAGIDVPESRADCLGSKKEAVIYS